MKIEQDFYIGLSDTNVNQELTNTSILRFLEDMGGIHSEKVGYGATSIATTKRTWILLSWKVKVLKRAKMNDTVHVVTWSRSIEKFYAYRDFKVLDKEGNVIAIATSKWIYMDIENQKIVKVTDEVASVYESENISVFGDEKESKLVKPENAELINKIDFKITRNLIDINMHLHNIYYMDIAKEALTEELYSEEEFDEFEVMYKKEIKLGAVVNAYLYKESDCYYVTIESDDVLHAIIKLK